jgi:uncharacterized GH25 family protein
MTGSLRISVATLALGVVSSVSLLAHDMWIEPATFFPSAGQVVGVKLRVGEDLLGDPIARSATLINEFVVQDSAGRQPVVGREGSDPAGFIRASMPGLQIIGYRSNASAVELEAGKFNQYLKEEGLDAVTAARARRNETGKGVRELFSRHAKSLVLTGAATEAQADRALGFPLELVAERNPYVLRAGQELPVRLTFEGRPLAGALVVAFNRLKPMDKLTARSDADGRVRFNVKDKGVWLVKAVHMVAAPAEAKADWVSYWASLTFEMGKAL